MANTRRRTFLKWLRRVWVVGGLSFTLWLVWNTQALGVPASALESSSTVTVTRIGQTTLFLPTNDADANPGVIFLPGAAIDPRAYVPFVRSLADAGYRSALVPLPWRLAPTDNARATLWRRIVEVAESWRGRRVVLAGHSRGGALAARFVSEHPTALNGLALIGTTHPRDQDLSRLTMPVVKILGSEDCVAPADDARANGAMLPASTRWVVIDGANHAQFGHYGFQLGDCSATISRDAQQATARDALVALLDQLE